MGRGHYFQEIATFGEVTPFGGSLLSEFASSHKKLMLISGGGGAKNNGQKYGLFLFCSLKWNDENDKNPHPGDTCHSQIPVGCLTSPLLGLDIDRCITYWLMASKSFRLVRDSGQHPSNTSQTS